MDLRLLLSTGYDFEERKEKLLIVQSYLCKVLSIKIIRNDAVFVVQLVRII
jgi:hypothetical protein